MLLSTMKRDLLNLEFPWVSEEERIQVLVFQFQIGLQNIGNNYGQS